MKDDPEIEMRKGVDSVMNAEGSMASVFCAFPPEVEQLIGKLTTFDMLFKECMLRRFNVFSYEELERISEASAQLCVDLVALNEIVYHWHYLQGHVMAELSRREESCYYNSQDDKP